MARGRCHPLKRPIAPEFRSAFRLAPGRHENVRVPAPVGARSPAGDPFNHPHRRSTASFLTGCGAPGAYRSTIAAAVAPSASRRASSKPVAPSAALRQARAAASATAAVWAGQGARTARAYLP